MIRRGFLGAALLFGAAWSAGAAPSPDALPHPGSPEPTDPALRLVAAFLAELDDLQLVPGFCAAVVRGDSVAMIAGFGLADFETGRPVTTGTRFPVQEIGGGFLGVAAACLHVRGELDLDAPLSDLLPDLRLLPPLNPAALTLRDLLGWTHTLSGWGVPRALVDLGETDADKLLAAISRTVTDSPDAPPHQWPRLGELGFLLATLALDHVTGIPWPDLLDREVFGPLGMSATTARRQDVPAERIATVYLNEPADFAAGRRDPVHYVVCDTSVQPLDGILSTAHDLARWSIAALNDGRIDGRACLPPGAFAEVQSLRVDRRTSGDDYRIDGTGLGHVLGHLDGRAIIHYAPGNFRNTLYPDERIGVVLLANSFGGGSRLLEMIGTAAVAGLIARDPDAESDTGAALAQIRAIRDLQQRGEGEPPPADSGPEALPPPPLDAFIGAYQHQELGVLLVSRVGESLHASLGCRSGAVTRESGLPPVPGERLFVEALGAVEFTFSGNGTATAVTWRNKVFRRADS